MKQYIGINYSCDVYRLLLNIHEIVMHSYEYFERYLFLFPYQKLKDLNDLVDLKNKILTGRSKKIEG